MDLILSQHVVFTVVCDMGYFPAGQHILRRNLKLCHSFLEFVALVTLLSKFDFVRINLRIEGRWMLGTVVARLRACNSVYISSVDLTIDS